MYNVVFLQYQYRFLALALVMANAPQNRFYYQLSNICKMAFVTLNSHLPTLLILHLRVVCLP